MQFPWSPGVGAVLPGAGFVKAVVSPSVEWLRTELRSSVRAVHTFNCQGNLFGLSTFLLAGKIEQVAESE